MRERPILAKYRGPAEAPAGVPSTGGEDLSEFIAEADALRQLLGYQSWADLTPLCDGTDPKDLDRRGLVKLIGLLGQEERRKRCQQLTIFDALEGSNHV